MNHPLHANSRGEVNAALRDNGFLSGPRTSNSQKKSKNRIRTSRMSRMSRKSGTPSPTDLRFPPRQADTLALTRLLHD